jgi:acyl-CoA synthetase (AMP-forming)/AMP-acid ligase II
LRGAGFSSDRIVTAYGMTEAAGLITTTTSGVTPRTITVDLNELTWGRVVPISETSASARLMVSCGHASHGVSVAIVDPDTLVECAPGELGELCYSSPSLFQGYFARGEPPTEIVLSREGGSRGGYFRSGDLAAIVGDEIFVAGRLKETISIGGRRLIPLDIEQCASAAHSELFQSAAIAFAGGDGADARVVITQEIPAQSLKIAGELRSAVRQAVIDRFGEDIDPEVVLVRPHSLPSVYTSAKKPRLRCRQQYLAGGLCVVDAG